MTEAALAAEPATQYPPGAVVVVRDETWLVQRAERASDGWFVEVRGLSPLVRGTEATFSDAIETITVLDPAQAAVRVDDSPGYRTARLWLEATARKTPVPLGESALSVATAGLVDVLPYQVRAVRQALDPDNLRPRILLADAVGLGKTIEIGMILAELVRRGRGERMLVVTPRHVLEQMQFELWTRFALPFVRLDSLGIQRIRQLLPANRNPFAHFKRAIVSIDTLKSDRYHAHLEQQHWDVVVIDESHNVTNDATQNNRLARLLSSRTDALILASATPHNGKKESFAELIRMLEPSAVTPRGELIESEVRRLVIRRHRYSEDVAAVVGADWAERHEPSNVLVPANAAEDEIAAELERTWLHPPGGASPYAGRRASLFPWTLAKAFLSSAAALRETVLERQRKTADAREREALERLRALAERAQREGSSKLDALLAQLERIGIRRDGTARVVIFAERRATLEWLRDELMRRLRMRDEQVGMLHGGLSDVEQQEVVASFKQEASPLRVLVAGDIASEGVNLHHRCHELIHFDIPWSLIRIEQRNGRIDRYGQRHRPRITTLLLTPSTGRFSGDVRVLQRLVEKEHEAHRALGDSASLMGRYDVRAEEDAIREVLAGSAHLDDVVKSVDEVRREDSVAGLLARLFAAAPKEADIEPEPVARPATTGLYPDEGSFLKDALELAFATPGARPEAGGVNLREHVRHGLIEFAPSPDLRQRLEVLPQTYLKEQRVRERLMVAVSRHHAARALDEARSGASTSPWPTAHYLAPLHPALDWAADRALAALGRNEIFAIAAPPEHDELRLLVQGTLTNARGQVVTAATVVVHFPDPADLTFCTLHPHANLSEALATLGITGELVNTGALAGADGLDRFVARGVERVRSMLEQQFADVQEDVERRVERWIQRVRAWELEAEDLIQREQLRRRRAAVVDERGIAASMRPAHRGVRPLLLVVPAREVR